MSARTHDPQRPGAWVAHAAAFYLGAILFSLSASSVGRWRTSRLRRAEETVIVIQVSVRAKPEHAERFEQTLRQVVGEARQVAGCGRYDWFRSPDVEREAFIYAEFDSEEAFAQYRQGPVVKKIGAEIIPLLEARPQFKHFRATVIEQG